jgi:hypothetical protein
LRTTCSAWGLSLLQVLLHLLIRDAGVNGSNRPERQAGPRTQVGGLARQGGGVASPRAVRSNAVTHVKVEVVGRLSHVFEAMKLRGASTPAGSTTEMESRGKGGPEHRWIARYQEAVQLPGGHRSFHRTRGGLRSRLCDPRTRCRRRRQVRIRQPDESVGRWCF